jgi:hypothetical protein
METSGMRFSSRLLLVTVMLLFVGILSFVIGFLLLAVVDFVGTGLFFLLWARRRFLESVESKD